MTDATSDFFDALTQRGPRPPLANITATIRIDLEKRLDKRDEGKRDDGKRDDGKGKATEHWLVTVDDGNISVSKRNVRADAVLHTDKDLFDRLVLGEANAMASVLRGLVRTEGDSELLVLFQRLLPGPPDTSRPAVAVEEARAR
jgi:putative sterol carrier protein